MVQHFDNVWIERNILDSVFVVGAVMTSFGIIAATNITDVFLGFRYSFRQMFGRRHKHLSFYDYQNAKRKDRRPTGGIATLIVGVLMVAVTAIMSLSYIQ